MDTGSRLRITGEGDSGSQGGPSGDLYVLIDVEEHEFFERRDQDLFCLIPVSFSQAVLGTEISVPTLGGDERFKIPSGTQSDSVFRIRGGGIARSNGRGHGDLYITVKIEVPLKLSKEQRALILKFAETEQNENQPIQKKILERVKEIFG